MMKSQNKMTSCFLNMFVFRTDKRTDEMWCHESCIVYLLKSAETNGRWVSRCICLFIDVLMELHRFRINAGLS